jgi:hypothetical protein
MPSWFEKAIGVFFTPRPKSKYDEEWEKDQRWGATLTAKEGADYEAASKYADDQYKEMRDIFDAVDKKAEWIFGIAFAGSGALLFAMKSWGLGLYCLPALACTVAAMHFALRAKAPGPREMPLPIKTAVEVIENDPSWRPILIAGVYCATTALKRLIDWKGDELQKSARALFVAATLFALPAAITSIGQLESHRPGEENTGLRIDHFELSESTTGGGHIEFRLAQPGSAPERPVNQKPPAGRAEK